MTTTNSSTRRHPRKRPMPLAPPVMRSRRQARKVTTAFHRLTRERDAAAERGDAQAVAECEAAIEEMGGRKEYQIASQVSTAYFSTSKWVLGFLSRNGLLHGIPLVADKKKAERRTTRVLEVGAINTELLEAAQRRPKLSVRAIDLHSMHDGIEEADFLDLPVAADVEMRYDVIVCSMVLNCATTAEQRGEMVARLYHFLRPGGLAFVTIPKSCLTLSPYMDDDRFQRLLRTVGMDIVETKESPKVSFFIGKRSESTQPSVSDAELARWSEVKTIRRGKKYRNDFSILLSRESVEGRNIRLLN